MKALPVVITLSLAANAALIALVLNTPSRGGSAAEEATAAKRSAASGSAVAAKSPAESVDIKTWSDLSAGDLSAQVARLRAAGFPPSVVRAMVAAQLGENYSARRKELMASRSSAPFWERNEPADPKVQAALRELSRDYTKQMKDLLGSHPYDDDPAYAAYQRRQFGDLPADKVEQLVQVRRDYDELRSEIYAAARGGAMLPEDRAKLALLDKEQRADFAKMLTPQELENYELRSSNTANSMRYSLDAFGPNEAEFRAIYQLQRPFDEKYSTAFMMGQPSEEQMKQRQEAQKELTAQIKAALGPERAAEYERATDYQFQQVNRIVSRLDLPKETAAQVWEVQKDIQQRAAALRSTPGLSPAARTEQLAALAQEATTKVGGALGPRGLEVYKQYSGSWIQNLQGRAGPGNPGATGSGMIFMGP
jgi:hypothetical protein